MLVPSCEQTYESECNVSCEEGFVGNDITYLCNVTNGNVTNETVEWVPVDGQEIICKKGLCIAF